MSDNTDMRSTAPRPLEGLRVADFTSNLAGPFCTLILSNLGAEVVKLERIGVGDDLRAAAPFMEGYSSAFEAVNGGKRSVAVDLRTEAGGEIAKKLVASSDILVESMRPGKMEELGFGFGEAADLNRSLVYCSVSGYGHSGPESDRPGYDTLVQARTGMMAITGHESGPPARVGPSIVDIGAGMWAAINILAAVVGTERGTSTVPVHLDVSLFDAGVTWMILPVAQIAFSGEIPTRMGGQSPLAVPIDIYKTSDGYIAMSILNDSLWNRFVELVDDPSLRKGEYRRNADRVSARSELTDLLNRIFQSQSTDHWLERLQSSGITVERLNDPSALLLDDHARARGMVSTLEHPALGPLPEVGLPLVNSGFGLAESRGPAPHLGADTRAVLAEIGYSLGDVSWLLSTNVVQAADSHF